MRLGKEVVGLSQMSGSANDTLVMKRSIPLGKIGAAEKWLNCMAENGHVLSKVEERNFWFTSEEPKKLHFLSCPPRKALTAHRGYTMNFSKRVVQKSLILVQAL